MTDTDVMIFLDVDGVINAQMAFGWGKLAEGDAIGGGYKYRIRYAPAMVEALSELEADLMWSTTWRTDAVNQIAPLIGWGDHGDVLHPNLDSSAETSFPSILWKMNTLEQYLETHPRPFIHIDDEHSIMDEARIRELGGLPITPNFRLGITPKDIEEMRAYIEEHK